ncbi:hypothetical protein J6397_30375 [Rhodococcus qingshengii]|uniref:hypothetical protein n=1 Tax=Rhodococcus qingshengii TaxID=334542 RepID=UPI001AEA8B8F|nr:hypothetical protein [Rhodococcus qingshengii]MBP1054453.1 hypothetical protein [Rhodococcus qingshengii]
MADDDNVATWLLRLREAARTGDPLDLAADLASESPDRNPAHGQAWGTERQIPAAALRAVLIDHALAVDPHGLRINGAWITGPVDLAHLLFEHPLHLRGCGFERGIDLSSSSLTELNLAGSHIISLNLEQAAITGNLIACDGFTTQGEVRALCASVGGQIDLTGATLSNPGGVALGLDGATVAGGLFARAGFTAQGEVRALHASVGAQIDLTGASLSNPDGVALGLDGTTVTGDLFAGNGFTAQGEVRAPRATIGAIQLDGATLSNPDGFALTLDQVTIAGNLLAGNGFAAQGEVRAPSATIGALQLDGATLTNTDGIALNLDQVTIVGNLFARNGVAIKGEFRAIETSVGGQIDLTGATLTNPDGIALRLDGATITRDLFARDGFTADGTMRAVGASIGGTVELNGATLSSPGGIALSLDRATIGGVLLARNGFATKGEFSAIGATIGSLLDLRGAILTNHDGMALRLDGATIAGDLYAQTELTTAGGVSVEFVATGEISAVAATIDLFDLTGATLINRGGTALNLERASLGGLYIRADVTVGSFFYATGKISAFGATIGQLDLTGARLLHSYGDGLNLESSTIALLRLKPDRFEGTLNLVRASITNLQTPEKALPPGRLIATGWQVTDVHGLMRNSRSAAVQWLESTPLEHETLTEHTFTAQPWHALAEVYEHNGQPADARRLRFTAANKVTTHAPWYSKPLRWIYLTVAGHGYYPLLAAIWLVGVLALGFLIVDNNSEHFTPTDKTAARKAVATHAAESYTTTPDPITASDSCALYPDYPCFNSLNYALAGVVPAATGVLKADWTISSNAPVVLAFGLPVLRILAWIFAAILLAGVTGLLRKT